MVDSIIDIMKTESKEANDGFAARKITQGEWITVRDNRDGTYLWSHSNWDADKPHQFGDPGIAVATITEEQALVFLHDASLTPPQDEPEPVIEPAPTFCGVPADQGRIVVGKEFPEEGYALLSCGNTEVKISYSVLHNLQLSISPSPFHESVQQDMQRALWAITCEASLGRTGDTPVAKSVGKYTIHPQCESQGEGNGWYDCSEDQATQWVIENAHEAIETFDSRQAAQTRVDELPL